MQTAPYKPTYRLRLIRETVGNLYGPVVAWQVRLNRTVLVRVRTKEEAMREMARLYAAHAKAA